MLKSEKMKKEWYIPFLFLLPAIVLLCIFRIYPIFSTFIESLYINNLNSRTREFVGLLNYYRILKDPIFWQSLKVTIEFNLLNIPIQVSLALVVAVIFNKEVRGISVFRSIVMIPIAVSPVVSATLWKTMMEYNGGIINGLLSLLNVPRQEFFLSQEQALWSIIIVTCWRGIPYLMIFWLAGLQEIPNTLIEQASIDGAGPIRTFFNITLPLLQRVFAFILITSTILNLILFAPVWLITRGGPELSTNLLMYETYRRGLVYGDVGGAAVMLGILVLFVAFVIGMEFLVLKKNDY